MDISMLKPWSIARAAENRKLDSHELEVLPIEYLQYIDGELTADQFPLEDKGVDGSGQEYTVRISSSNSVKATWLQWGSNRVTPPDIRRGERLLIYQFADMDKYYWVSLGLDDYMRRLETVIFAISNLRNPDTTEKLSVDNTYSVEFNTHTKQITLRTSKSDGEPYAYTFQFNTKIGVVTLADDDSNFIELNSTERRITAQNKDTSQFKIDKKDIFIKSPSTIQATTETITATCKDMIINASNSITASAGVSMALSAGATMDLTTDMMTIGATMLQGNIGITNFTGAVNILGLLTASGGIAAIPGGGGGGAMFTVPLTLVAPFDATGTMTNNGVNVGSTHQHNETGLGGGVTTPPI